MISVLAFGQSNMEGAYGPSPISISSISKVKSWSLSTNTWANADLGVAPFRASSGGVTPNNLAYVFCMELARQFNEDIRLVLIAVGGMKIEYFMPNYMLTANGWTNSQTSTLFGSSASPALMGALSSGGEAVPALDSLGTDRFDIVLMHQGEANAVAGDSATDYENKLNALFADLNTRGIIEFNDTYLLLGNINSSYSGASAHATAIDNFASNHSRSATVEWSGLETVGGGNLHATGRGLDLLGRRYFNEYMELRNLYPI